MNKMQAVENSENYHALTPKPDVENEVYFGALDFAFKNESIRNIAVTGSYGSGKSSVINSYINCRKNSIYIVSGKKLKEVYISLAKFNNAKRTTSSDINIIEYAILEQLFFREREEDLPDSQFARIKEQTNAKLWSYTIGIITFVVFLLLIIYRQRSYQWICWETSNWWQLIGKIGIVVSLVLLSGYALYKSLRVILNISVKALSLKTATIEFGKRDAKSVLNEHIDEILYFFKKTEYNVVVFEDLDRFDNVDIFIKLKEINTLINNSKTVNNRVVFVYALRDDMFSNKERTKFFDFILPIVPFVDGSNAVDKLYEELKAFEVDPHLCDVLSYYIGEMRMVYNIANEFRIYFKIKSREKADYDVNRLLALIAYKNCYPEDFAKLMQKNGHLYDIIEGKEVLIAENKKK